MKYFFAVIQLTVFIDPNRTSFFLQAVAWRSCSDPEHKATLGAGVSVQCRGGRVLPGELPGAAAAAVPGRSPRGISW